LGCIYESEHIGRERAESEKPKAKRER